LLKVSAKKILQGIKKGESVAVDGVCLTVTAHGKNDLTFDVMRETLLTTTLGNVGKGRIVNLERALKMSDRLSGHFVTGHIDGVGLVADIFEERNYTEMVIRASSSFKKYIVPKGAVCIDGVSLTVGKVKNNIFSVYLIPFTKKVTNLGMKKKKEKVNIETDILAKYILTRKFRE